VTLRTRQYGGVRRGAEPAFIAAARATLAAARVSSLEVGLHPWHASFSLALELSAAALRRSLAYAWADWGLLSHAAGRLLAGGALLDYGGRALSSSDDSCNVACYSQTSSAAPSLTSSPTRQRTVLADREGRPGSKRRAAALAPHQSTPQACSKELSSLETEQAAERGYRERENVSVV